jgi:hypothetical protein
VVTARESADGLQAEIGDRVQDPVIDLRRGALAKNGAVGIADVVPDEIVGVGRERGRDVACVLGGEVLLDDVRGPLPLRS